MKVIILKKTKIEGTWFKKGQEINVLNEIGKKLVKEGKAETINT